MTLLGVVFFFALAASNGWIGPVERVLLGAAASADRLRLQACSRTLVTAASTQPSPRPAPASRAATRRCSSQRPGTTWCRRWPLSDLRPVIAADRCRAVAAVVFRDRRRLRASSARCAVPACRPARRHRSTATRRRPSSRSSSSVRRDRRPCQALGGLLVVAGIVSVPAARCARPRRGEILPGRACSSSRRSSACLYLGVRHRTAAARGPARASTALASALRPRWQRRPDPALVSFVLLDGDAPRSRPRRRGRRSTARSRLPLWRGPKPELSAARLGRRHRAGGGRAGAVPRRAGARRAWAAETAVLAWLGQALADSRFQLLALAHLGLALGLHPRRRGAARAALHSEPPTTSPVCLPFWPLRPGRPRTGCSPARGRRRAVSTRCRTFLRELARGPARAAPDPVTGSLGLAAILARGRGVAWPASSSSTGLNVEPAFDWGHVAVTGLWSLAALVLLCARPASAAHGCSRSPVSSPLGGHARLVRRSSRSPSSRHVSGWSALVVAARAWLGCAAERLAGSRGPAAPHSPRQRVSLGASSSRSLPSNSFRRI